MDDEAAGDQGSVVDASGVDDVEALPLDERAAAYLAAHLRLQEQLGVASA